MEWTDRHQVLWDRLEEVDPITPEGERRYAERQADLKRAVAVREDRETREEEIRRASNWRARTAGALAARSGRTAPDPTGLGALWGAAGREPDRGERFTAAGREYWRD